MKFLAFIELWWPQIVFLIGAFAAAAKWIRKQTKKEEAWKRDMDQAIVAILHGLIWESGMKILERAEATMDELDNLSTMYAEYTKRGGNGGVARLMARIDSHVKIVDHHDKS